MATLTSQNSKAENRRSLPGQAPTAAAVIEPGVHVRSLDGIYKPLDVGRVQKVKDSQCKVEFNHSVFSRPPFRSQNYILRLDEIEVSPTPLELAKAGQWDDAWKFAGWRRHRFVMSANGRGRRK